MGVCCEDALPTETGGGTMEEKESDRPRDDAEVTRYTAFDSPIARVSVEVYGVL